MIDKIHLNYCIETICSLYLVEFITDVIYWYYLIFNGIRNACIQLRTRIHAAAYTFYDIFISV